MKIVDVRSYVLKCPLGDQGFYASQESFSERSSCLVRIETDSGLVGWGEAGLWGAPEPVAAMIDHVLTPGIIGDRIRCIWTLSGNASTHTSATGDDRAPQSRR